MAADAYIGWDELEEADDEPVTERDLLTPCNERLAVLLTERIRLERELNRLLGKGPPSDEEARENIRFPMPIHTAESRMEDRRIANEQLRASLASRRALERSRLRLLEERQRAERKREEERSAIQRELLRAEEERQRLEALELLERRRRVSEAILERWGEQRRAALRAREAARRAEWTLFDEKSARCRELAAVVSDARNRDHAAVHARLDRRAERGRGKRAPRTGD
jgi:hypothetical protein